MDEEQKSNIDPIAEILQRPKQKINVDSFFNRSDDAESITAISLKLASVIEQIDVMRTEIKDIATYITVEHKIEKDLREDRLFEEQDAKQKKEMKDRLTKGEQVPKTAKGETPQEESKGGGFFSGLLKLVSGLGLIAGVGALITAALPVITPILLGALAVGLTGLVIAKIAPPIVNFVKDLGPKIGNVFGGLLENTLGKVPLIGKSVINFAGKISGKLGEITGGISDSLKTNFGNIAGGAISGAGAGGPRAGGAKDSNLNLEENNAEKDMANTLKEKGVIKDTRNFGDDYKKQEEYFASDEYKQSFDKEVEKVEKVEEVDDKEDGKKFKVTTGKKDKSVEDLERDYAASLAKVKKLKDEGANERKINLAEQQSGSIKYVLDLKKAEMGLGSQEDANIGRMLKEAGYGKGESSFSATTEYKIVEPIDNKLSSMNMNNTSVVVPKNEPQVSSAEIKVTGTTLAYARALQNPYLSITNKKIPPELSRIG